MAMEAIVPVPEDRDEGRRRRRSRRSISVIIRSGGELPARASCYREFLERVDEPVRELLNARPELEEHFSIDRL